MKKVITIQHSQSEQHTNGMVGSWTDWDLTQLGTEQADRIGRRLAWELKEQSFVIYSSDLLRASHTAEIVAGHLGSEIIFTDTLREINLGEAVGKSKDWARENALCPMRHDKIDSPRSVDAKPFTGAESKREAWTRLSGFYNLLNEIEAENVIIVSHSGILSLFYTMWLGLPVETLERSEIVSNAGGVSFMSEDVDGHRILYRLNDSSYC